MSVVPLTLIISLCLVFTFVLFFLREYSRHRFSSAESEALLPLADETPRVAGEGSSVVELKPAHACKNNGSCAACQRRAFIKASVGQAPHHA